ncbi:DUF6249 domain-containing protein [Pedobacter cryoconitis]|uniref:DUF6249 domain-containing protein n=1 Tax=Pedobacter cryoconitis TaxID=188932 RepID=A0A7X0J1R9_9SPHI|nr:DUF6249 domain-containing protein [Pedobacter cryoconitis]MBB6499514.1 hypothetical protein [Pedobacter cryoconitis]
MEFLVPITLFICGFAMIFGIRYLMSKERMALIERGINPNEGASAPKPFLSLKFGLLLVGLGLGFLVSLIGTISFNLHSDQEVAVYFGCIAIFGGLGLICSYAIEKKWLDQQELKQKH